MLVDASSQCPRTRDTRAVLQCWVQVSPPLSICGSWLSALSVCPALKLSVVMIIMTSSWSPPSDCRCRPSRRQSRSSGTRWRAPVTEVGVARSEICIGWNSASPILLLFLLIHLTDGRALANAQQPCEVRCSPDNNCESYIQYLSRHLSYHKRGVEEGDDSIRY